jgi:hypothetical protein
MAAPAAEICLAGSLNEDCWRCIIQCLDGIDIVKVLGVSRTLHAICSATDIWANSSNTITLPQTPITINEIQQWRLLSGQITLNSCKVAENSDSTILQAVIEAMLSNNTVCPNLKSISLQHLPYTLPVIEALSSSLQQRAQSGHQLKKLALELRQIADRSSADPSKQLVELLTLLPEEVDINLVEIPLDISYQPVRCRAAIATLLCFNRSTIRFTLPGNLWANLDSEPGMSQALGANRIIQQLTLKAPNGVGIRGFGENDGDHISSLTKLLVHPSLRHLSIADEVVPHHWWNANVCVGNCTALYFADPECFPNSNLETLHIELGRDAPRGLLQVLHHVTEMPQLQEFTLSWPEGDHSAPRQVSMDRLREFLATSPIAETYKERPRIVFSERRNPNESVPWSTIAALFA